MASLNKFINHNIEKTKTKSVCRLLVNIELIRTALSVEKQRSKIEVSVKRVIDNTNKYLYCLLSIK
jgi:hypothetical protein